MTTSKNGTVDKMHCISECYFQFTSQDCWLNKGVNSMKVPDETDNITIRYGFSSFFHSNVSHSGISVTKVFLTWSF